MKVWVLHPPGWQPWPRKYGNWFRNEHLLCNRHKLLQVKTLYQRNDFLGGLLKIKTRLPPARDQAGSSCSQDLKSGSSGTDRACGERNAANADSLWLNYFKAPIDWWDNRGNKLHAKSPDFRHKTTKDALWVDHWKTPLWVTAALERDASVVEARRGCSGIGTGFHGECNPGNVLEFKRFQRNEYSWAILISQYTKCGQSRQALKVYDEMQKDGLKPSLRTLVALLKACGTLQDLECAKRIHREVSRSGLEFNPYVGTVLVTVYAKCKNVVEARRAFEKILHRDVVSWNAMLLGYAQMGKGEEALELYAQMQAAGIAPDGRTYVSVLKACSSLAGLQERAEVDGIFGDGRCLEAVRAIHADVKKTKFESDLFVGNMLVVAYSKCGSLEDAKHVFDKMPFHDVVSWNGMIFGYAQRNDGEKGLELFGRMQQEGVVPDGRTYVGVLKACISLAEMEKKNKEDSKALRDTCLETVRHIHSDVVKVELETDVFVGTMLVDVYAKCGSMEYARLVFEKMARRDVVSWTAMILGYALTDKGEEALDLFARMQHDGVVPDARTYVSALKACGSLAESEERNGNGSIAVRKRCLDIVRGIHSKVVAQRFETDVFVGTMLVDVYAKCGSMEDAIQVFKKMPHRDVVSWNAVISGYTQTGKGQEALQLFVEMQLGGVVPDDQTYVSALKACGSVGVLGKGKEIHAQLTKPGPEPMHKSMASSLIDMYAKCGSMVDAQQVFDALPTRDTVAWSALITGYARQGDSDRVLDLLQRMQHEGIQPDGTVFLGVLMVCSHGGLVEKGQTYFEAMRRDYGITPTMKHFTCLVDILGRAGLLDKAMEMVKKMPFQPHSALWNSVLCACQKWTDVELGRQAFECAVKIDKNEAAAYVLMSNIYAAADMQEEAEEIQALRVSSGAYKQPGRSWWMDTSGLEHVFFAGDHGPESRDMQAKLKEVVVNT